MATHVFSWQNDLCFLLEAANQLETESTKARREASHHLADTSSTSTSSTPMTTNTTTGSNSLYKLSWQFLLNPEPDVPDSTTRRRTTTTSSSSTTATRKTSSSARPMKRQRREHQHQEEGQQHNKNICLSLKGEENRRKPRRQMAQLQQHHHHHHHRHHQHQEEHRREPEVNRQKWDNYHESFYCSKLYFPHTAAQLPAQQNATTTTTTTNNNTNNTNKSTMPCRRGGGSVNATKTTTALPSCQMGRVGGDSLVFHHMKVCGGQVLVQEESFGENNQFQPQPQKRQWVSWSRSNSNTSV